MAVQAAMCLGNMTNLTQASSIIKKIASILVFPIVIILLSVLIFLNYTKKPKTTPTQPTIPPPVIKQDSLQKPPQKFDFSELSKTDFPKNLPAYSVQNLSVDENIAQNTASALSINTKPSQINDTTDGKQFIWNLKTTSLAISQTTLSYHNAPAEQKPDLTETDLQNRAQALAGKLSLLGELTLNANRKYLLTQQAGEDGLSSADSYQKAQFVEFFFDKTLSSYPVVTQAANPSIVKIRMRKDGEVITISGRFYKNFLEDQTITIASQEAAVNNILKGSGKVVSTQLLDNNNQALGISDIKPQDIPLLKIQSMRLAYFLPNKVEGLVQPIFVFEGNFTTQSSQRGKAIIYLPVTP